MKRPFRRGPKGTITLSLGGEEREFLASVFDDIAQIVSPQDKTLWRLYPPRYDDPARQASFELGSVDPEESRREMIAEFQSCRDLLQKHQLQSTEADQLLRGLNRMRLVLAGLLHIEEDDFQLPPNSPQQVLLTYDLYNFLAWLVTVLVEELPF